MDCEKPTLNILDVCVRTNAGVRRLQLQGDSDPRRRFVDERHQGVGRQGHVEGEDPAETERHLCVWGG